MYRNDRQAHQAIESHVIASKSDKRLARQLDAAEAILADAGECELVAQIRRERTLRLLPAYVD